MTYKIICSNAAEEKTHFCGYFPTTDAGSQCGRVSNPHIAISTSSWSICVIQQTEEMINLDSDLHLVVQ